MAAAMGHLTIKFNSIKFNSLGLLLKLNLTLCAKHIVGKNNNIADALSRFQMERFRLLATGADLLCSAVPQFPWNL